MAEPFLDVLTWNVHLDPGTEQDADQLFAMIDRRKPHVASVQETGLAEPTIRPRAERRRMHVVSEKPARRTHGGPVDERGDTMLLFAAFVVVRWARVSVMRRWWTVFSKNRKHRPRRYPNAGITVHSQRWRVAAVHLPTRWGANWPAFLESLWWVAKFLRHNKVPAFAVGDLNWFVSRLARWFKHLHIEAAGEGIDGVLLWRCHVEHVTNLGKHGSDHAALLIRIRKDT